MSDPPSFLAAIRAQKRCQMGLLFGAALAGASTAVSAVLLVGLSGWFIAGAATACAGGVAAVMAFNYLLPSAAIRLFAIVRTGGRYAERLLGHAAAFRAMAAFRTQVFEALAGGRPEVSLGFSSGEASSRLVQDVDAIEIQFVGLSAPLTATLAVVAGLLVLLFLGIWPALVLCFGVGVQTLGGRFLHRKLTQASSASVQTAVGQLKEAYNSLADAAPELICYGYTGQAIAHIMKKDCALASARTDAARGEAAVAALQAVSVALTSVGVLIAAGHTSPAFAAMATLASAAAVESAGGLLRAYERKGAYQAAVGRLSEIETKPDDLSAPERGSGSELRVVSVGRLLEAKPGVRIALCGRSGVGKTQLIEEMLKLRPASTAKIWLGGVPIERLSANSARALFSYLPQNAAALSGTIKENLLLGNPAATDDALWTALRAAELDRRVADMPQALMTWVGNSGERLSGGERRRLCLARALLRSAPWLILDEPTEGLDSETEKRIVRNIDNHLNTSGQGLVLVSHRAHPITLCPVRFEMI